MSTSPKDKTDQHLDDFFAEIRQEPAALPADLISAILTDANAQQPAPKPLAPARAKRHWWQRISDALGGWQAGGALAACAVVGLGVGLYTPDGLSELSDLVLNFGKTTTDTIDMYSTLDDMLAES